MKPNKRCSKCFESDFRKIILEVQHELNITDDPEEIKLREGQIHKLIQAAKNYYGYGEMPKANLVLKKVAR